MRTKSGSVWESNPLRALFKPSCGFEDRGPHQRYTHSQDFNLGASYLYVFIDDTRRRWSSFGFNIPGRIDWYRQSCRMWSGSESDLKDFTFSEGVPITVYDFE